MNLTPSLAPACNADCFIECTHSGDSVDYTNYSVWDVHYVVMPFLFITVPTAFLSVLCTRPYTVPCVCVRVYSADGLYGSVRLALQLVEYYLHGNDKDEM